MSLVVRHRLRFAVAVATVVSTAASLGAAPAARADGTPDCVSATGEAGSISFGGFTGYYAAPATTPKAVVVFDHGYSHTAAEWKPAVEKAAGLGALAIAVDYPGETPGRGWFVSEGAAASVAAARLFEDTCGIATGVVFGVSMGGNTAGLAVERDAMRDDGAGPVFNVWFDLEGVNNLAEEYVLLRGVATATGNADAAVAQADIEQEVGGPIESMPLGFTDRTVVAHPDLLRAAQLSGAVIIQAVDDGLVPYTQSHQLARVLDAVNIPYDQYTVLRRDPGSKPGTTFTSNANLDPGTAGHATETDLAQTVMRVGFDRLAALLDGHAVCGQRESFVDSGTTTTLVSTC
jgi:hypothetical protein